MSKNLDKSFSSEDEKEQTKQHNNISASIEPTHQEKKDLGIVQSHTNYSTEPNVSQNIDKEIKLEDISKDEIGSTGNQDTTLNKQEVEPVEVKKQVIQPIKTQQASIQTGVTQKNQILPSVEQTYAPEHCEVRSKPVEVQNKPTDIKSQSIQNVDGNQEKKTQQQVEIQVGVSSLHEPEKVINKAKQQRVLENYSRFERFIQDNKTHSENQKAVLLNVFEQIEKKKMQQYSWYYTLREYFTQYAGFTKQFFQKCEKAPKQQKVDQMNKFLNIGEELREGFNQLAQFKRQTGDNYKKMYEYITTNVIKELQDIYNKYINQMNAAQALTNEKKKQCLKFQQQFKKQGWKVQKMFTRVKQGKKQQEDFFIEITKLINLQKQFRDALILWGKQIVELRKSLVDLTEVCTNDIQVLLNSFKNESNNLYGIQKSKHDRVVKCRDQIVQDTKFSKLITLTDADYIRFSLETSLKKQVIEITDQNFIQFVEMPQMQKILVKPNDLLHNLIVKIFNLKDDNTQLVNTVSGNLVLFNKENSQSVDKISLKNIKEAIPMEEGTIEIKFKVPGIIFNSKKTTKFQFKDGDRAQELICFLSNAESSDK